MYSTLFIIVSLLPSTILGNIFIDFIPRFFVSKNITLLTIISCFDKGVSARLFLSCSSYGLQVSFKKGSLGPRHPRSGGFLDLQCPSAPKDIQLLSQEREFNIHREWLVVGNIEALSEAYILPGSSVTYAIPQEPSNETEATNHLANETFEGFLLYQVYRHTVKGPLILEPPPVSWSNRSNLRNCHLSTSTVIMHPEVYKGLDDTSLPDVDTWPKIHYPVTHVIAEQLNCSYDILVVNDYGWEVNGSFDGLMGTLQRDEVDFAETGIFIRQDRWAIVDYTVETFEYKSMVMFRQPSLSSVANIFVLPFSKEVWASALSLCFLSAILFAAAVAVRPKGLFEGHTPSLADIFSFLFSVSCQQGSSLSPGAGSARVAVFILLLASLFLYNSFAANIVALLQSPSSVLHTVADLVASPLQLKVQDMKYNRVFFQESTDPDIVELYKKKLLPQGSRAFCTPEQGIKHVRSGQSAFLGEVILGYKMISGSFEEDEKCGLSEMRLFYVPKCSMAVTKKSGLREIVAQKVAWQKEVGILDRIGRQWLPQKPRCDSKASSYVSVGMTEFAPALLVMLYGFLGAFIVFLLEIIFYNKKKLVGSLRRVTRRRPFAEWQMK